MKKILISLIMFVACIAAQGRILKGSVSVEEIGYIGIDYNFKYQTVTHVYRKSDAYKQGLKEGDKILRVDGQEVEPYPNGDHICGIPHTRVQLQVYRAPCWFINFTIMREYADECLQD
jgi:C-terminal processing protease CtpA/Prc